MQKNNNILVVDDDPKIRRLLLSCLEPEGYGVFEAENSVQVYDCLSKNDIDLVTLDLNLGSENGLTIASSLKASSDIPIIIVTGKGDVIDKVVGLEMGADDYISKPFHVREVVARVRSVLRRSQLQDKPVNVSQRGVHNETCSEGCFSFDNWIVDFDTFELKSPQDELVDLTSADFKILKILVEHPKRVLSREQIMDHLHGQNWTPYDRTIDNQIARLRRKLEKDPSRPQIIKTVRGVGYTFSVDVKKV
ncbi:MAG: response regulator [Rhizobiaceae bacterium]